MIFKLGEHIVEIVLRAVKQLTDHVSIIICDDMILLIISLINMYLFGFLQDF